ncbi:hypothetical protein EVAR_67344_1 [Eumeta japonica]|uniref:Uncharacterized protein n=1 Tax=Eumeta variegata TaxID=151549 RepID=A0A4C2A333_EUMVA|nr:hypothetical protein EVAR_67344_1 [Eumeta japonica]
MKINCLGHRRIHHTFTPSARHRIVVNNLHRVGFAGSLGRIPHYLKRKGSGLSDEFRDGRPSTAVTNKNIDTVRRMIETDRHPTYHEIRASLGIAYNPDLAPCDIFLFVKIKNQFGSQRFSPEEAVEGHVSEVTGEEWRKCFQSCALPTYILILAFTPALFKSEIRPVAESKSQGGRGVKSGVVTGRWPNHRNVPLSTLLPTSSFEPRRSLTSLFVHLSFKDPSLVRITQRLHRQRADFNEKYFLPIDENKERNKTEVVASVDIANVATTKDCYGEYVVGKMESTAAHCVEETGRLSGSCLAKCCCEFWMNSV